MKRKKIKILIDATPLAIDHFSGVGHSLLGMVRALEDISRYDSSIDITLFAPHGLGHNLRRWGLDFVNFRELPLPFKHRIITGLQHRNLLPPIDMLLGHGLYFFPNFLNWRTLKSKKITLIHDISYELHPEFVDGPNQRFLQKNVPISIARSDFVASVSKISTTEVEHFYKLKKGSVELLPNAVDRGEFYKRDESEISYIKAKYGVSGNYFIFVGNLEPRKNIKRMIDAYISLPKEITDNTGLLLIGGGGWNDDEIREAIIQSRIKGYRIMRPDKFVPDEDLPALYSGSRALLYVPVYEGFGMPPLEAMACSVPVVSSDIAVLKWVIGDAGILVNPHDTSSIAAGIKQVLDIKVAEKLRLNGLNQIEKFNWSIPAVRIVDLAKEALK